MTPGVTVATAAYPHADGARLLLEWAHDELDRGNVARASELLTRAQGKVGDVLELLRSLDVAAAPKGC